MNIGFGRMDKIFLTHLHGDHMSDLVHLYCFGPTADRKSPLFIWGPGRSGVANPYFPDKSAREYYKDGTRDFCAHLRELCRWHSESQSFLTTSYEQYPLVKPTKESWGLPWEPRPVGDDSNDDGYAIVPMELTLERYKRGERVAYHNRKTGVKITYFPVIHTRVGSIGYKLEWKIPGTRERLTMIYTGDTKPETNSRDEAINGGRGVDVLIHEMASAPQVWAMKVGNEKVLPPADSAPVQMAQMVENSSHTPQGAFGYLLSTIVPRPRLTVANHFSTQDDTVECALKSLREHCPVYRGNLPPEWARPDAARVTWSFDGMVITISKDQILEQQGVVEEFGFQATLQPPAGSDGDPHYNPPKYSCVNAEGEIVGDPYAQIDESTAIAACGPDGHCRYNPDGY
jgi:ribonuclease Z